MTAPADLTPAERRVWQAFPRGEGVDFRESVDDDPAAGGSWGPERTVRAEVLRALLVGGPTSEGDIAGLKLTGARVSGQLNLMYGTVDHPVRMRSCHFEQAPNLYGARLPVLVLSDSVLPGISAGNLRVDGVLRLSCCRVTGPLRLQGAKTSGAVFLNGARLGPRTRRARRAIRTRRAALVPKRPRNRFSSSTTRRSAPTCGPSGSSPTARSG